MLSAIILVILKRQELKIRTFCFSVANVSHVEKSPASLSVKLLLYYMYVLLLLGNNYASTVIEAFISHLKCDINEITLLKLAFILSVMLELSPSVIFSV